jgi:hypothetical protein
LEEDIFSGLRKKSEDRREKREDRGCKIFKTLILSTSNYHSNSTLNIQNFIALIN